MKTEIADAHLQVGYINYGINRRLTQISIKNRRNKRSVGFVIRAELLFEFKQNSSRGPRSMVAVADFEKIFSIFTRWRTNVRRAVESGKRFRNMARISIGQVNTLLPYTPTYRSRSLRATLLI